MASAASNLHAGGGNERFNHEAQNWDANPFVHAASEQAQKALLSRYLTLRESLAPGEGLDVLEIGCGTGLLSLLIAPYAQHVVAVDAAQGMIDVMQQKLNKPDALKNITPVCVLLENPEDTSLPPASPSNSHGPRKKFDLIISHLVLHHIPELRPVLETMLGCLKTGGSVALTDFEDFGPEARRFHPLKKMAGVERHGIHTKTMTKLMQDVGFVDVDVGPAWTMKKSVEKYEGEFEDRGRANAGEGEVMEFPFLVCYGRKP